jgi:hypothetical protein
VPEPDKFYTQHHAVEAPVIDDTEFRQYWRVHTRLDTLLADRAISIHEWRAGQAFRSIAHTVLATSWPTSKWLDSGRGGGGIDYVLVARHDAISRLHELHRDLGGFAIDLLEAHIVDDESWSAIGRRLRVHPKTARTWTIIALRALAAVIWA